MRILAIAVVALGAMLLCVGAVADESAELADLTARVATLESQLMAPAGGGDAQSLTSLRQKGQVRIGGNVELDVWVVNRDEANDSEDEMDYTNAFDMDADLDVRVDGGPNEYLFMKLDLDDNDDLVEELQFVFTNVRGYPVTIVFGEDEIWFGEDRDELIADPYVHGQGAGGSIHAYNPDFVGEVENVIVPPSSVDPDDIWENNPHESPMIMTPSMGSWEMTLPGEVDNRFALQCGWEVNDWLTVSGSLFQNTAQMTEDRSRDHGIQSYAVQAKVKPNEQWQGQISFINQHDDLFGDDQEAQVDENQAFNLADLQRRAQNAIHEILQERLASGEMTAAEWSEMAQPAYGGAGTWIADTDDDTKAISASVGWTSADTKWEAWAEYIYGWDVAHLDELDSHTVSLGALYMLTERIALITQGGYVHLDNEVFDTNSTGLDFEEELYRASVGSSYTLDSGITFLVEYMHEWYKNDLDGWENAEADLVAFRTLWEF